MSNINSEMKTLTPSDLCHYFEQKPNFTTLYVYDFFKYILNAK